MGMKACPCAAVVIHTRDHMPPSDGFEELKQRHSVPETAPQRLSPITILLPWRRIMKTNTGLPRARRPPRGTLQAVHTAHTTTGRPKAPRLSSLRPEAGRISLTRPLAGGDPVHGNITATHPAQRDGSRHGLHRSRWTRSAALHRSPQHACGSGRCPGWPGSEQQKRHAPETAACCTRQNR